MYTHTFGCCFFSLLIQDKSFILLFLGVLANIKITIYFSKKLILFNKNMHDFIIFRFKLNDEMRVAVKKTSKTSLFKDLPVIFDD